MKLIGLVGFIGSGKGTFADVLVEKHGFVKESFANGVKDATATVFGWDRKMLEGDTDISRVWREKPDSFWSKKFGKEFSPRLALQLMGTEAGRGVFHEDLWIYSLERRLQEDKNYAIADVRFPNEIKAIQEMGGKVVRIKRGPNPEWYYTALDFNMKASSVKPDDSIHSSEWAWIGTALDAIVDNNCDLEQVPKNVDKMLDSLYNIHVEANEVI
jgi:hypothetical protein